MRRFVVKSKVNDDGDTVIVFIPDQFGGWCEAADVQELVDSTNDLLSHAVHRHNCAFVRSPVSSGYQVECTCGLGRTQRRLEKLMENFFDE